MSASTVTSRRAYRRTRIATSVGMGTLVLVLVGLPVLPWVMGIVTEMQHVYIDAVPAENEGTYLVTDDGVMQLYRWKVEPTRFPEDAPVLDARRITEIAIVQDAFGAIDDHELMHVDDHDRLPWSFALEEGTRLTLRIGDRLEPGRYHLVVPTDSMYGGVYHYYFVIDGGTP